MTEISGDSMTILTSKEEAAALQEREGGSAQGYTPPKPSAKPEEATSFKIEDEEDDLPF